MKDIEDWIYKTLVAEDDFIDTSSFESKLDLYLTPLANNFVSTIINGTGTPAGFKVNPGEFQYNYIIRHLSEVTGQEPAAWFYYTVIDNTVGRLNQVWDCNYEYSLDYALEKFEREPAEEGGVSFLGLVNKRKSWLLLHSYEPSESFKISFHGSESVVKQFENVLNKSN